MRFGIDARFYGPSAKGLGRYTEKLIQYLGEIDRKNEYVIFLRKNNFDELSQPSSNFKKILADFPWYSVAEQMKMPAFIKKQKIDLMHFPHFNVPLFFRKKFVVTIHDLILTNFPTERASTLGPILYRLKHFAYSMVIKSAVSRAEKIITVSKYSKDSIIKTFKQEPSKIEVTYEAVSDLKYTKTRVNKSDFFKKTGIKKPFLLYVGNAYPHKNLERFLHSFKTLIEKDNLDIQLVMVGKIDYFYQRLKKFADELKLEDKVLFLGYVSDEELKFLYQHADLYVFPSLIEGFGLPPLEAMTQGLPVVSSGSSCLPEILGDAAYYFDSMDESDMAQKVKEMMINKKIRNELRIRGFKKVKEYSWLDLAKKTLAIYKSVIKL